MSQAFAPLPRTLDPKNPADREKLTQLIEETIAQSRSLLNGKTMKTQTVAEMDDDLLGRALRLVSEANDLLVAQRNKINKLEGIVSRDEMTGLLNRRGFEEQLSQELSRVRRGQSMGCSMVIFDLDDFKAINDNYGHPAGDAAIRKVGEFFNKTVRETDVIARMGGDEFALILTNIENTMAERRAKLLSDQLNQLSIQWDSKVIPLHGSYGLARCVTEDKFDRLYRAADEALYRAKVHRKES
ncbi:MAG TPA: GGDEF domain-containing protein [Alphaproteobacteria bacterium]|nr:GGDEF domain-containing protein [Rhodospirillaceae bacterium]HRJ12403.1 GGDEF domain-containing protein [Alphaproteobacteria bacterium]